MLSPCASRREYLLLVAARVDAIVTYVLRRVAAVVVTLCVVPAVGRRSAATTRVATCGRLLGCRVARASLAATANAWWAPRRVARLEVPIVVPRRQSALSKCCLFRCVVRDSWADQATRPASRFGPKVSAGDESPAASAVSAAIARRLQERESSPPNSIKLISTGTRQEELADAHASPSGRSTASWCGADYGVGVRVDVASTVKRRLSPRRFAMICKLV